MSGLIFLDGRGSSNSLRHPFIFAGESVFDMECSLDVHK